MGTLSFFKRKKIESFYAVRDDICGHLYELFPQARNIIEADYCYNDPREEILFITNENILSIIKCVRHDMLTVEYLMAEYEMICKRWRRHLENTNAYMPQKLSHIPCIVFSDGFGQESIEKIKNSCTMPVQLYVIQQLIAASGEVSYAYEMITQDTVVETIRPDAQLEETSTELKEHATSSFDTTTEHEMSRMQSTPAGEALIEDECIDRVEKPEDQLNVQVQKGNAAQKDFFQRTQLSDEEEHEFFLLNKQLSDS